MTKIGYERFREQSTLTFAQKVKREQGEYIRRKDHEGTYRLDFKKNEREFVSVKFEQFPNGQFVKHVSYHLKDKTMKLSDFRDRVIGKYGEPSDKNSTWYGDQDMSRDNISSKEVLNLASFYINLSGTVSSIDIDKAVLAAIPKSSNETTF